MNNYIDDVAKKKESLYRSEFLRYAVRAMYAGMYLTLGSAVAFIAANHFSGIDPVIGRAIYALLFPRSEEHTSELQSRFDLVCRLLLEKKNRCNNYYDYKTH